MSGSQLTVSKSVLVISGFGRISSGETQWCALYVSVVLGITVLFSAVNAFAASVSTRSVRETSSQQVSVSSRDLSRSLAESISLENGPASVAKISAMLPSTDEARLTSLLSTWSSSSSVSLFNLNLSEIEKLEISGTISGPTSIRFASGSYDLIARRATANERFVNLTLDGRDGFGVLSLDRELNVLTGWLNTPAGKAQIIRPVPRNRGRAVDGAHLLIDLDAVYAADSLSLGSQASAATDDSQFIPLEAQGPQSLLSQVREPAVVELDKPLTVYVAFTRLAYDEAQKGFQHPTNLVDAEFGTIERAFLRAGVYVRLMLVGPDHEESLYRQSADQQDSIANIIDWLESSESLAFAEFRQRRAEFSADIGILVVHHKDSRECGNAGSVGKPAEFAYFAVNWKCIRNLVSGLHELGHVLGAHHSRVIPESEGNPRNARAFVNDNGKNPFVTVMGNRQGCKIAKCSRIAAFSNPLDTQYGVTIGDADTRNNASTVAVQLASAVNFGESLGSSGAALDQSVSRNNVADLWSADIAEYRAKHEALQTSIGDVLAARETRALDPALRVDRCALRRLIRDTELFHFGSIAVGSRDIAIIPSQPTGHFLQYRKWMVEMATEAMRDEDGFVPGDFRHISKKYHSLLFEQAVPSFDGMTSEEWEAFFNDHSLGCP